MVDPHHPGVWDRGNRGRRARGAVDHGHFAEELAFAQRHNDGLGGAVHLGDLDLSFEHHEQFAPVEPSSKMTSSTSNSLMHFSIAIARPLAFWLVGGGMLVGKPAGANGTAPGITLGQHEAGGRWPRGCRVAATKPARMTP
jgi:hypothetical protein